jgi:response regulator RpfG family c-di-GMP phosphodiesterase
MSPHVLVLDDFMISNEMVSNFLRLEGYEIASFQCSNDAVDYLKNNKIDAIITDYLMPGKNGIEFLIEVRELPGYQNVPVIFLSGKDDADIIRRASQFGAAAWLKKPLNTHELIKTLNKYLIQ